jgi:hypothetical protein
MVKSLFAVVHQISSLSLFCIARLMCARASSDNPNFDSLDEHLTWWRVVDNTFIQLDKRKERQDIITIIMETNYNFNDEEPVLQSSMMNVISSSENFSKRATKSLNGLRNLSILDPAVYGIVESFYRDENNMVYPHLTKGEKVFGSFSAEMSVYSLYSRFIGFLLLLVQLFYPKYAMYSLFITNKKIVTARYSIYGYLAHHVDREDFQLQNLVSFKVQQDTRHRELFMARQFYVSCFNIIWIRFFQLWLTITMLIPILGIIPLPYVYMPVHILHLINFLIFFGVMTFQAIRLRITKRHELKQQRLIADIAWIFLSILSIACIIVVFAHFRSAAKVLSIWDVLYYSIFFPEICCLFAAIYFIPSFACPGYATLTLNFNYGYNRQLYMTYKDALEAKACIEEALNYK